MINYGNETLCMLRKIACHMQGELYKDNDEYDNILYLKDGLREYTVSKLDEYGYKFTEYDPNRSNFQLTLKMLEEVLEMKKVSKKEMDEFFYQYLNSINYIVSAMQDRKEPKLSIVEGNNIEINKENNMITNINIGKEINPTDKIILLINSLKDEYKKGITR